MAVTARKSVIIDRPPEEVWAVLNNPTLNIRWRRPSLQRFEQLGAVAIGPGTRYEGVVAIGPKKYPYVTEITSYEPPKRLAWKGISSAGWMIGTEGSYELEGEKGRTRMNFVITMEANSAMGRLFEPLVRALGGGLLFGPIPKQLKEAVEQPQT